MRRPSSINVSLIQYAILDYLERFGYGYNAEIAFYFKRSRSSISRHLKKLSSYKLIQQHGRAKCPYQWYSINQAEKEKIKNLIKYLKNRFKPYTLEINPLVYKKICFASFNVQVLRFYKEPSRPWGFSIPYPHKKCFKELYKFLKKYYPGVPRGPPNLWVFKRGRYTYHIQITTPGLKVTKFYWLQCKA